MDCGAYLYLKKYFRNKPNQAGGVNEENEEREVVMIQLQH